MLGLNKEKVILCKYDLEWKNEFIKEKEILKNIMKDYALDIQHVGSTSIPGLSAKPILDIAVAVRDKKALEELIPIMTNAGYDVKYSIEDMDEILARKGVPENRTHYIHIEIIDSIFWNNHIQFRDYLLTHQEAVREYEELKLEMSKIYKDDRKLYTAHKNEFIQSVLNKAKNEK